MHVTPESTSLPATRCRDPFHRGPCSQRVLRMDGPRARGDQALPLPSHPTALPAPPSRPSPPRPETLPTICWALAVSLRKAPDSRLARSWEKWRLSTRRLPEYTWLTVASALYPGQEEASRLTQGADGEGACLPLTSSTGTRSSASGIWGLQGTTIILIFVVVITIIQNF